MLEIVARRPKPEDWEIVTLLVTSSSASLDISPRQEYDGCQIEILAKLENPILGVGEARLAIARANSSEESIGFAMGIAEGHWIVRLMAPQRALDDLLVISASEGRLARVTLAVDKLKRGRGGIRSVAFSTRPEE